MSTPDHPTEKRASSRVRSLLRGRMECDDRLTTIDCILRNVSETGASMEVTNGHMVPSACTIVVPARNQALRAQTVWRTEGRIGVRFLKPDETPQADRSAGDVRTLREENDALRATVRLLEDQLRSVANGNSLA